MPMADDIQVEVAYALPNEQWVIALRLPIGATARDAIERSGVLSKAPDWTLEQGKLGIYSRPATLDQVLRDRDRVELYRPLLIDPKEARRQRAKKNK